MSDTPSADEPNVEVVDDPDVGPTNQRPSVGARLEQAELISRGIRIQRAQRHQSMIDEANEMSKHEWEEK